MSAPQLSTKRRFINGQNDWRYQETKAPVTTSDDQYIFGTKQFADNIKALSNVFCSGSYYGDGTHLTNVTGTDPTKLPLVGGTLTGPVSVSSVNGESELSSDVLDIHAGLPIRSQLSAPSLNFNDDTADKYVAIGTSTITGGVCGTLIVDGATGSNAALALAPTPTLRLEDVTNGNTNVQSAAQISLDNGSNNTTIIQPLAVDLSVDGGPQTTQLRIDYLRFTDDNVLDGTICHVGAVVDNNATGLKVTTGNSPGNICQVIAGFDGSAAQEPLLKLNNFISGQEQEVKINPLSLTAKGASSFTFTHEGNPALSPPDSYQFLRWGAGMSLKTDPNIDPLTSEHFIDRNQHVKVFDMKNGQDPNKAFVFRDVPYYLTTPDNLPGFSVLLTNCSDNPARIEPCSDGTLFYCKDISGEQPEFYLHQWDTTRVTLVILSDNTYRWAVSMYR